MVTLPVGVFGVSDVSVFDSPHTCVPEYIEIFGHFYGCSVWAGALRTHAGAVVQRL